VTLSVIVPVLLAAGAAWAVLPPVVALDRRHAGRLVEHHSAREAVGRPAATAGVVLGAVVLLGTGAGVVVAAAAGAVSWHLLGRMEPRERRRRRELLHLELPHVVDLLAATLAAGLAPGAAVEQIGAAVEPPMREELAAVAARLRLGVDPATAWHDLSGHPQLGPVGRCLYRAVESGASVAEAMNRLAEDLRRDNRAEIENRARAVGVRAAVPLGLCMLPAFVLLGVVPLVAGSLPVVLGR
jgi:Flp pilus assembly protein TadB